LDNYALSKVPIPHIQTTKTLNNKIQALVHRLLDESKITKQYLELESIILQLYGIQLHEMPADYQELWKFWENKINK